MAIKRTIEIYVETTRRFVVCQPEAIGRIFCPVCGSPMLAAEQLAALRRVSRRAVYQWIETGAAHFIETDGGAVYVCPAAIGEANSNGFGEK